MNVFDHSENTTGERVAGTCEAPDASRVDIERCVARARQMRAEYMATWIRNAARSWLSVFRGRGRLLPSRIAREAAVSQSA